VGLRLEVRKRSERELILKVYGETHTLGNLLAKSALRHPNVRMAAYSVEHPLEEAFVLRLVTDGTRDPANVLKEVVSDLIRLSDELLDRLREALGVEVGRT
jgi:DNA-directed RNA polymerase subunit L